MAEEVNGEAAEEGERRLRVQIGPRWAIVLLIPRAMRTIPATITRCIYE